MKKDDTVYLHHMLDAIQRIQQYVKGIAIAQFRQNGLVQDAAVYQLLIIGEASRNVSDEFQASHSEIPWSQVIALRNRIVHAYFEINLQIVWDIVQNDLPPLKQQLAKILGEAEN